VSGRSGVPVRFRVLYLIHLLVITQGADEVRLLDRGPGGGVARVNQRPSGGDRHTGCHLAGSPVGV
jgi:hypothetical protein